ncbi:MAG: type III pantothenate kinase [Lachnospiraceae bacterium]|nr:type III pantothenate kinase [Lachnospiraceae bacterium]
MLLAVDVGNTNITIGAFERERLVTTFRMTTKLPRTSDEYGTEIRTLLTNNGISPNAIDHAIFSSVVPNVMHSLTSAMIKYFNVTPIVVEPGITTGLEIATENPRQLGADRIVDAVGAYELYGGPLIVIDYGTATTYDLVDEKGVFLAGVICPGIRLSAKALCEDTAKLPEIEIKKPNSILGRETISCIQAGLFYGQVGQTEYIVERMKQEANFSDIKVVATGGLGKIIAGETESIDIYDSTLTLQGMRFIYERQK